MSPGFVRNFLLLTALYIEHVRSNTLELEMDHESEYFDNDKVFVHSLEGSMGHRNEQTFMQAAQIWRRLSFAPSEDYTNSTPSIRLKDRLHQLYFHEIPDKEAHIFEGPHVCSFSASVADIRDPPENLTDSVLLHFFCDARCCERDCCEFNQTFLVLFASCVLVLSICGLILCSVYQTAIQKSTTKAWKSLIESRDRRRSHHESAFRLQQIGIRRQSKSHQRLSSGSLVESSRLVASESHRQILRIPEEDAHSTAVDERMMVAQEYA